MKKLILIICSFCLIISCQAQSVDSTDVMEDRQFKVQKTEQEWKSILNPEQFAVLREKGTERPFTGEYNMHFKDGIYHCGACEAELFKSDSKFDGHCGWPSFDNPINDSAITEVLDKSHGMVRTEILCTNCGGHLGHLFNDGPTDSGLRYCVNSLSLGFGFDEKENKEEEDKAEKED